MAHASTDRDRTAPEGGGAPGLLDRLDRLRLALDDLRVREHLRRAESDLRAADTDHLSADRTRRRRRRLDRLRAYRKRAAFPRNRVGDGRVPCFVGAEGTDCAVGHLLRADGHGDLVDRVGRDATTVRVEDLPAEPESAGDDASAEDLPATLADDLDSWLDRNGFTRSEAARIQPSYGEAVQFATTCGPVACRTAAVVSGLVATALCAGVEYAGYRFVGDLFPDNALKRRVALGYLTVLTLVALPLLALVGYALFP